jgi:rod shape-determining protein MreC
MDHQPPPFFKRGPAPLARLSFYAAISLALIFFDARFHTLELVRQGVSLLTQPLQQLAQAPLQFADNASAYFFSLARFRDENTRLKRAQLEVAATLQRTQQLETENDRLRKLLDLRAREQANGQVSKILYTARDPFSRRIVVDRGLQDNITAGQPVIDDAGLVGQVTRVFPRVSEITLITDKDQAVPVQIVRNGLRSVVFGLGNGQLELRFMPANADVQNGDLLVTSGLDGVFVAGLPVAKVVHIERDTSYSFARIYCVPVAGVENFDEVVVLDAREPLALPPQLLVEPAVAGSKPLVKGGGKKKRLKKD